MRLARSGGLITHGLMLLVRHPNSSEFAGPQELRQDNGIATVRLYSIARLPWDQRWCDDHAGMSEEVMSR
jgi:hypothetical protein